MKQFVFDLANVKHEFYHFAFDVVERPAAPRPAESKTTGKGVLHDDVGLSLSQLTAKLAIACGSQRGKHSVSLYCLARCHH